MFKCHDNITVNESEIVVLLRHVWVYAGEKELRARDISLTTNIISQIAMVGMRENEFQTWC